MTYQMRGSQDCGPAALAEALGLQYEVILANWPGGWRESGSGRLGMPNDTPYDHFALLERLNIPWRIVTDDMILRGECKPRKTILLFHHPNSPTLKQHWVLYVGKDLYELGDGPARQIPEGTIRQLYRRGWPNCAYEIGLGPGRLSWWQKTIAYFTGQFA